MNLDLLVLAPFAWAAVAFPVAAVGARGRYRRGRPPGPATPGVIHHVHHHFVHVDGEVRVIHGGVVHHEHRHQAAAERVYPTAVDRAPPALDRAPAALAPGMPRVVEGVVLNGRTLQR